MKLPDFFEFEPLNRLKSRMGMREDDYGSFSLEIDRSRLTRKELDRLTIGEGIDVYFDEVTILPDGTLAYKDSRVLLYIRDVHINGQREWEPRYHLFNCRKLVEMSEKGRFDRYVVSARADGIFKINLIRENKNIGEDRRLRVCQLCLDGMSLNGFNFRTMKKQQREQFVAEFIPDEFFKVYPRSLHAVKPKHDSNTAPLNIYPPDFSKISERVRREKEWQCENCHKIFSEPHRRSLLHVHHINGIRSDNTSQNLKVLCAKCHAEEHPHMR